VRVDGLLPPGDSGSAGSVRYADREPLRMERSTVRSCGLVILRRLTAAGAESPNQRRDDAALPIEVQLYAGDLGQANR
jgi:hypothetical protein